MEVHGAVQWLMEAYTDYRHRVFNNQIGYKAFFEENLVRLSMPIFIDEDTSYSDLLQEATDRDKVKHILENRKFTEDNFATDTFEEADAIKMIAKYNAIGTKAIDILHEEVLPIAKYPEEAKEGIAAVFRKHKLLCPDITSQDLLALLTTGRPSCQYMIPPFSRNGDLGLVINILSQAGALTRNWSSIICNNGMLRTSTGAKMESKNLSAAMHKFDGVIFGQFDDKQREIHRDILRVLATVPCAVKNLRK